MATTEAGHAPNRVYVDQDGYFHINGAGIYLDELGSLLDASGQVYGDDDSVALGTSSDVELLWETADANANEMVIDLPTGDATNVPVIVIGQAIENVDLGLYNGVVDPRVAILSSGAVTTGPVLEFRKARGTSASPTVVTTGDDIGQIDFYGAVAAGEYVRGASIQADMAGTIATTRGPGTLTFKTATDAAPSVLTTAMTISAAQLVTCAAGLTVTSGAITASSGNVTITSGNLTLTSGNITITAASDFDVAANTAAALEVDDGTTKVTAWDTRNTVKDTDTVTITGVPVTVASETAAHRNASLHIAAKTVTYTGTTATTSSLGAMLYVGVPTFTDASAMTLTTASAVHINAVAAAGGSLTISNSLMISTSVSDCFLTNAGVWTDTSSVASGKEEIADAEGEAIDAALSAIRPRSWKYREDVHGVDHGTVRLGIVSDELPPHLRTPGQQDSKGVSSGVLSSFNLAAVKRLHDRLTALEQRI